MLLTLDWEKVVVEGEGVVEIEDQVEPESTGTYSSSTSSKSESFKLQNSDSEKNLASVFLSTLATINHWLTGACTKPCC